jgi:hypothetical protein
MAARLAAERRKGSATENIVTEASLQEAIDKRRRLALLIRDSRDLLSRLR